MIAEPSCDCAAGPLVAVYDCADWATGPPESEISIPVHGAETAALLLTSSRSVSAASGVQTMFLFPDVESRWP